MQKFADGLRVAKGTSDKIFRSTPGVLLVHLAIFHPQNTHSTGISSQFRYPIKEVKLQMWSQA
jgi:hypothetical protein